MRNLRHGEWAKRSVDILVWCRQYWQTMEEEKGEVMHILNVRTCTIAGLSTFQRVLCERVHAITVSMLTKLQKECGRKNCPTLLCSANMEEKNSKLQMWNGFRSRPLIFRTNPKPNKHDRKTSSTHWVDNSENFAKHLNALYSSW